MYHASKVISVMRIIILIDEVAESLDVIVNADKRLMQEVAVIDY